MCMYMCMWQIRLPVWWQVPLLPEPLNLTQTSCFRKTVSLIYYSRPWSDRLLENSGCLTLIKDPTSSSRIVSDLHWVNILCQVLLEYNENPRAMLTERKDGVVVFYMCLSEIAFRGLCYWQLLSWCLLSVHWQGGGNDCFLLSRWRRA